MFQSSEGREVRNRAERLLLMVVRRAGGTETRWSGRGWRSAEGQIKWRVEIVDVFKRVGGKHGVKLEERVFIFGTSGFGLMSVGETCRKSSD